MPAGFSNNCEDPKGESKADVIHAEVNALNKLSWTWGLPLVRTLTMFITHTPCVNCARAIVKSEVIDTVFYENFYRDFRGIAYLSAHGIKVTRLLPGNLGSRSGNG